MTYKENLKVKDNTLIWVSCCTYCIIYPFVSFVSCFYFYFLAPVTFGVHKRSGLIGPLSHHRAEVFCTFHSPGIASVSILMLLGNLAQSPLCLWQAILSVCKCEGNFKRQSLPTPYHSLFPTFWIGRSLPLSFSPTHSLPLPLLSCSISSLSLSLSLFPFNKTPHSSSLCEVYSVTLHDLGPTCCGTPQRSLWVS